MRYIILIITFVFFGQAFASSEGEMLAKEISRGVQENCAAKWGDNYRMQKHCVKRQLESYISITESIRSFEKESEEHNIIIRCLNKWPGEKEGFNYRMALHCSKGQLSAYKDLEKLRGKPSDDKESDENVEADDLIKNVPLVKH